VSKDVIELIGIVVETFPNATFRVRVTSPEAKDHELLCTLAGRMRVNRVRILPGDRVRVEMTPYDLEKGRITYRFRSEESESVGPVVPGASPPPPPAKPRPHR
jgi:translation initiation factor IF-1